MEMETKYHSEMFTRFMEQCPEWAEKAVSYRPKHMHAIRVMLQNGDQIDYNVRTDTYRYVSNSQAVYDDSDEHFRSVFASNLSEMMYMRGVGQAILAERTGLSSAMISKYLRKLATPSMTNVLRIARALDCHPDELYE